MNATKDVALHTMQALRADHNADHISEGAKKALWVHLGTLNHKINSRGEIADLPPVTQGPAEDP